MATVVRLAQYEHKKGRTKKEAILIANGTQMNKVLLEKERLFSFMDMLNRELVRTGVKPIEPEGSIKGSIISSKEFDERLVFSDTCKSEKEVYPAWTGTAVAYNEKDAKLGNVVKYTDSGTTYIFEVPKEYQNEKNAILVVNHGFLANGDALIVPNEKGTIVTFDIADKNQIALLQNFPSRCGLYSAGNRFGIPLGNEISSSTTTARELFREDHGYVGLLARDYIYWYDRWGVIAYDIRPSFLCGVLIDTDRPKAGAATT